MNRQQRRYQSRTKNLPREFIAGLGEAGRQPIATAAQTERPAETPNPILGASEPFSFPVEQKPVQEYGDNDPRPVVEAEIDELMEWGLPKYQEIYPRCTAESVRPMLIMACRGGRMRFLRTANGAALFIAETTPWEPQLYVYQVLVVTRIAVPREALRLWRAGERWAREIGAIAYEFGGAPEDVAERIGRDKAVTRYIKVLTPPIEEPEELMPGARMAAIGMEQRMENEPR
jgi:hypothetical protein